MLVWPVDRMRSSSLKSIVVVAEGAKPVGGNVTVKSREVGRVERLGGIGETIAAQLQQLTGQETRSIVLGHLLRGGSPTAMDRNLGVAFGAGAVQALSQGLSGVMVALKPPRLDFVPRKKPWPNSVWSHPTANSSSPPERSMSASATAHRST